MFICPLGSEGPGSTHNTIVHLCLNLSVLGRFSTVIMIAETLYSDRLNGLNRSTFSKRLMLLEFDNNDSDGFNGLA